MFLGCALAGSQFYTMYAEPKPTCYYGKVLDGRVTMEKMTFETRSAMRRWVNRMVVVARLHQG